MKEPEEPMFTITATDRHGVAYRGRIRRLVPRECLRLQGFYDWQIDRIEQDTSDSQLYKQAGNGVTVNVIEAIGTLLRQADRMKEPEEPMFTITATDRHGVAYRGRIRRLVPRECLRLQGFYDWQIDRIEQDTSDSQLYKQAGNGVTVNVIEAIGTLLRQADAQIRAADEKTKR